MVDCRRNQNRSCRPNVVGGPRVVVSTAAFHARVCGSVPSLCGLKETKMFLSHPRVKVSIVGSLRDREVACSASDRQGSNPLSGGQCHLNQLTILRRFSWPSLAYMCTKVAYSPIHFLFIFVGLIMHLDLPIPKLNHNFSPPFVMVLRLSTKSLLLPRVLGKFPSNLCTMLTW